MSDSAELERNDLHPGPNRSGASWWALGALALAQFVMVLDQAVMNVSISQLVDDFDTTVATIQGVITFYSLVMAMLMLTGGKVGDIVGRRRAFVIGLVIYGCGSALTAVSGSVAVLTIGWSVLEGIGAALVLPALAALIAGNYEGKQRAIAYAVIGGVAGAGIAVGPIVGGWATTELTWRIVFVGEVVLVIAILALTPRIGDARLEGERPNLDILGSVLSALGLGVMVLGMLQASTWGWLEPKDSPVEPFGFALTPFVVAAGGLILASFSRWERHREATGRDPLVHLDLVSVPTLRSGLYGLLSQNVILMGVFFSIPLYLQLVVGLDALETGIRMLPVSVTMFVFSAIGSRLTLWMSVRTVVRGGLVAVGVAVLVLLGSVRPELTGVGFSAGMALLGVGMGLMASQLGNVVQSSVDATGRGEAGGLQYTGQQLGSSIGVALIGSIVLAGLTSGFVANIENDERISDAVAQEVSVAAGTGVDFVAVEEVETAVRDAGVGADEAAAITDGYRSAQVRALKAGLLVAAFLALVSLLGTAKLPSERSDADARGRAGHQPPELQR